MPSPETPPPRLIVCARIASRNHLARAAECRPARLWNIATPAPHLYNRFLQTQNSRYRAMQPISAGIRRDSPPAALVMDWALEVGAISSTREFAVARSTAIAI